MVQLFNKIETSFKAALRGEESLDVLVYRWGIFSYIVAFLMNKLFRMVGSYFFTLPFAVLLVCYFVWHIYVLRKCTPKKPKLTKEEQQKLREERRKELGKKLLRKLFLQESITKWNPVLMATVTDAFCIAQFFDYITK